MTTTDITGAIAATRAVFESVPVAGEVMDYLLALLATEAEARVAGEWKERALVAEGALADAKEIASVTPTAADQAAAAMAAESQQMFIAAEKSVAHQAVAAAADPLDILAREVHGLSNKLQQPVDLVVQLLVLSELRGMRADSAGAALSTASVLS